jgi:putative transcriptional regulator
MDDFGDLRCKLRQRIREKAYRERRDITYEMIQEATGINPSTLSLLANNRTHRYDAHVLARLCFFFGCEIGDLLEYVPPERGESTDAETLAG